MFLSSTSSIAVLSYFESQAFQYVTLLMALFLAAPLLFIALDYWAGIRKAKQRGEPITSSGMQRTTRKVSHYYNALFALVIVDTLLASSAHYFNVFHGGHLPTFPFLTLLGALSVSVIEIRSIYEAANAKEKKATIDAAKLLTQLLARGLTPQALAAAIEQAIATPHTPTDTTTSDNTPQQTHTTCS